MFYVISLIKMLYWMASKTDSPLTRNQLIHAIHRNFDGLDEFNAAKIFLFHIEESDKQTTTTKSSKELEVHLYINIYIIKYDST